MFVITTDEMKVDACRRAQLSLLLNHNHDVKVVFFYRGSVPKTTEMTSESAD